jgi:ADP-heptose:LPS heptosyltransferase/tetratricopeptide (TPR) repeat protein
MKGPISWSPSVLGRVFLPGKSRRAAVRTANAARDQRRWHDAAHWFRAAIAQQPWRGDLYVQLGNVLKEAGSLEEALAAYARALEVAPTGDVHLQIGHLMKLTGDLGAARRHYEAAAAMGSSSGFQEAEDLRGAGAVSGHNAAVFGPHAGLVRALAECHRNLADTDQQIAVADYLFVNGFEDAARSVYEVSFIRDGFTASELQFQSRVATRTGLWAKDQPGGGCAPGVEAGEDLAAALALVLRSEVPGTHEGRGDVSAEKAGIRQIISSMYAALCGAPTPDALAQIAYLLDNPASASTCPAVLDLDRLVDSFLAQNLEHLAAETADLALGPFGSPRIFYAASRLGTNKSQTYLRWVAARESDLAPYVAELSGPSEQISGTDARKLSERLLGLTIPRLTPEGFQDVLLSLSADQIDVLLSRTVKALAGSPRWSLELLEQAREAARGLGHWDTARHAHGELAARRRASAEELFGLGLIEGGRGDFRAARAAFEACLAADPAHPAARGELVEVLLETESLDAVLVRLREDPLLIEAARNRESCRAILVHEDVVGRPAVAGAVEPWTLAAELAPDVQHQDVARHYWAERIDFLRLGTERRRHRGRELPVLRGVEAVRALCCSSQTITGVALRLNGRSLEQSPAAAGSQQMHGPMTRYVCNFWLDTGVLARGFHVLEVSFLEVSGGRRSRAELVFIDDPRALDRHSSSDAVVVLDVAGQGTIDDRINRLPSMRRAAGRSFFRGPLDRVLVVRADQLGDLVTSLPAIRRLKELLPAAELTALVTPANERLAREFGVFSHVITTDLRYDHRTKRRHLSLVDQAHLRRTLEPCRFDVAIDLSPGLDSRPLLKLAAARYTVGFKPRDFEWLSFGIDAITRDHANGRERASHATLVLSLVEAFGAALNHRSVTLRREGLDRTELAKFGLESKPFVVLHAGARLLIKRWPFGHYVALAKRILELTPLEVVLISDEPIDAAVAERELGKQPGLHLVQGHLPYDTLEALLSYCSAFVGNDTGPKHLAALRGAPVVSLHMGQVNWDEWGQEGHGFILSRRVPCCGCGIEDVEDCGKNLACLVKISPEEAFAAVQEICSATA